LVMLVSIALSDDDLAAPARSKSNFASRSWIAGQKFLFCTKSYRRWTGMLVGRLLIFRRIARAERGPNRVGIVAPNPLHLGFCCRQQPQSVLNFKILCRHFALVRDLFVFDNLPLIQAAEASFLHHRNVNEPPPCELNHFTVPRAISEPPKLTIKDTVANVKCQLTAEAA